MVMTREDWKWLLVAGVTVIVLTLAYIGNYKYHAYKTEEYKRGIDRGMEALRQEEEIALAEVFVQQYSVARQKGDIYMMLACAMQASEAYLRGKDTLNYSHWLKVQEKHERQLGL